MGLQFQQTALHLAAAFPHTSTNKEKTVCFLLKEGLLDEVDTVNHINYSCLRHNYFHNTLFFMYITFLQEGATALHNAAMYWGYGCLATVKLLVEAGSNVNAACKVGTFILITYLIN